MYRFHYTDKEINEILKTMVIVADSREQKNEHITDYLQKKGVPVVTQKLDFGDYSCLIPKNEALGVPRNIYLNSVVERKADINELCTNLTNNNGHTFESELLRSKGSKFVLFVEDPFFDRNIVEHNYRSQYKPESLRGRLDSLQARYNFEIRPVEKSMMGHVIYHRFRYEARNLLKQGAF